MHTLNILSLNVNLNSDVARFQNKYYKLAAFSCALNKTKGVLILVNRKLHLTIEHLGNDEEGRFVFIRCKIHNTRQGPQANIGTGPYTFAQIYLDQP